MAEKKRKKSGKLWRTKFKYPLLIIILFSAYIFFMNVKEIINESASRWVLIAISGTILILAITSGFISKNKIKDWM